MNVVLIGVLLGQGMVSLALQSVDGRGKEFTRSRIRKVDFANHSYTIQERDSDRDPEFGPVIGSAGTVVKLTNGEYQANSPVGQDWVRVSLRSVSYGDLTDDGREEAIVALRLQSGGTQSWGLLFIYESIGGKIHLLKAFWTGDRA